MSGDTNVWPKDQTKGAYQTVVARIERNLRWWRRYDQCLSSLMLSLPNDVIMTFCLIDESKMLVDVECTILGPDSGQYVRITAKPGDGDTEYSFYELGQHRPFVSAIMPTGGNHKARFAEIMWTRFSPEGE